METKGLEGQEIEKMQASDIAVALSGEKSILLNVAKFEHCQRVANMLYQAKMWPDSLKTIGDAMITLNLADRLNMDPVMVAQNISVIHGKPGFDAKLVIGLINECGRFDPIQFEETGNLKKPTNGDDGCLAFAKEKKSGKVLKGPKVDWDMVQSEGWYNKSGSKWKGGLAPLMFRYRAASYFANVFCPEVKLGLQTKEELQDIIDVTPKRNISQESTDKPQVDKSTYQAVKTITGPKDFDETHWKETKKSQGDAPEYAFLSLNKQPLKEYEEAHREEIKTWPQEAKDAFDKKWQQKMHEPYADFLRKLDVINGKEPESHQVEEEPQANMGIVKCPLNNEAVTLVFCKNARGQGKSCLNLLGETCEARFSR